MPNFAAFSSAKLHEYYWKLQEVEQDSLYQRNFRVVVHPFLEACGKMSLHEPRREPENRLRSRWMMREPSMNWSSDSVDLEHELGHHNCIETDLE